MSSQKHQAPLPMIFGTLKDGFRDMKQSLWPKTLAETKGFMLGAGTGLVLSLGGVALLEHSAVQTRQQCYSDALDGQSTASLECSDAMNGDAAGYASVLLLSTLVGGLIGEGLSPRSSDA